MRFKKCDNYYLDTKTGLKWEEVNYAEMPWEEAIKANYGWRLPTLEELLSIVDYTLYDPATELSDMLPECYWSSTTYARGRGYSWVVYFYNGLGSYDFKSGDHCARYIKED